MPEAALKELIERTAFAMAQQDVRYYLNGLLFDLGDKPLRCVATDGHRLALCETPLEGAAGAKRQIIVPRKGVTGTAAPAGRRRPRAGTGNRPQPHPGQARRCDLHQQADRRPFPGLRSGDPDRRRPRGQASIARCCARPCSVRRSCPTRSTAASASKCRPGQLKISAHNPEQEEAQEEIEADTKVDDLAIGFNVNYLLDALSALRDEHVVIAAARRQFLGPGARGGQREMPPRGDAAAPVTDAVPRGTHTTRPDLLRAFCFGAAGMHVHPA